MFVLLDFFLICGKVDFLRQVEIVYADALYAESFWGWKGIESSCTAKE